jgi:hypothetical protein
VRPGHPFIGVRGRRWWPGRAGGDGKWHPFNGVITKVKEGGGNTTELRREGAQHD